MKKTTSAAVPELQPGESLDYRKDAFRTVEEVLAFLFDFHGQEEVNVCFDQSPRVTLRCLEFADGSDAGKARVIGQGASLLEAIDDALIRARIESDKERTEAEELAKTWQEQSEQIKKLRALTSNKPGGSP